MKKIKSKNGGLRIYLVRLPVWCLYIGLFRDIFGKQFKLNFITMTTTTKILAGTLLSGAMALQGTPTDAQSGPHVDITFEESVRPFHANVSDASLKDLRKRIQETRWPDRETVADQSQGAKL
ncbi:MAG: epoxide hydrolase N-terminal domain-containing protein, partial [Ginsengibacter sp.]